MSFSRRREQQQQQHLQPLIGGSPPGGALLAQMQQQAAERVARGAAAGFSPGPVGRTMSGTGRFPARAAAAGRPALTAAAQQGARQRDK